jgi:hypothetical protein
MQYFEFWWRGSFLIFFWNQYSFMIHIISLAVLSCPGHCLFPLVQSVSSVALYWVHRGYSYDAAGLHCILLISGLLFCLQDGKTLPNGPVVISPDGLFPSLYREGRVFFKNYQFYGIALSSNKFYDTVIDDSIFIMRKSWNVQNLNVEICICVWGCVHNGC